MPCSTARDLAAASELATAAGATAIDPRLVLSRVLAPRVEPLFALMSQVRAAWRQAAWQLSAEPPRVWRT
jgi:hypothetical protein